MNKDLLFISNSFSVIKINALTYKTFALVFVFLKKKKNLTPTRKFLSAQVDIILTVHLLWWAISIKT